MTEFERGFKAGRDKVLMDILKLIPLSQQIIDTVNADFDVKMTVTFSAKEYMKIFK